MIARTQRLVMLPLMLVVFAPGAALACPICFGADPDSSIAQGVNWAIFMLLGVTGGVLSGFVGFIFHLMKKSREAIGQEIVTGRHEHSKGAR